MKCKYFTVDNGLDYPMPDEEEDKKMRKLMEQLADKYELTSLVLMPEYIDDNVYVFTFQIPEKYNSKEYLELWEKIAEEKDDYAKKLGKEEFMDKYTIDFTR